MTPYSIALLFSIIITLLSWLFLKSKRWQILLALVLPLCLTPYWISLNQDADIFVWIKSFSVFASLGLITLSGKLKKYQHELLSVFLGVNIFEAVLRNASSGFFINAVTGILLLLPLLLNWWKNGTNTQNLIVDYGLTELWIIAYTLWNIVFILTEFPYGILPLLVTLLLPLFMSTITPTHWLHWRAISFSLYFYERLTVLNLHQKMYLSRETPYFVPNLEIIGLVFAILMLTEQFIRPRFLRQPRVTPLRTL